MLHENLTTQQPLVHVLRLADTFLRDVYAKDLAARTSLEQTLQRGTAATADVEHCHPIMERYLAKSPVGEWGMAEIHKAQHATPQKSFGTGTLAEKILENTLLYDFYGELLTEKQRKIFEMHFYEDLSLGEIGETEGISRQGVHDLRKRCDRILEEYEERLHLVERFLRIRERIQQIRRLTNEEPLEKSMHDIDRIAQSVLEEL